MKRSFTGLVLALAIAGLAAGCGDTNNTFQPNTGAFISYLAPSRASAGGPDFTLTLNGAGFVTGTVVQWNGQNRTTTYVSSSQVLAAITAADIATSGTAAVRSINPSKGPTDNGLSNTVTFYIDTASNPIPTISSISINSASTTTVTKGSLNNILTINGTNFISTSLVYWNAGTLNQLTPTPPITGTQINVTIPDNLVTSAGTAVVSVFNPAPGGGTSNGVTLTIQVTSGPVGAQSAAPIKPADGGTIAPSGSTTSSGGGAATAAQDTPAISGSGRFVAYTGYAPGSADGITQIFLNDTCVGAEPGCVAGTLLISAGADGTPGDASSQSPAISADGRYVAFSSAAGNLAPGAPAGRQIYLRDTCTGAAAACVPATQLISLDPAGALTGSENILPSISASGRFVAFLSVMPGTGTAPNSGYRQVFVRDTCIGATGCTPQTLRISLQPGDAPANGSQAGPALSGNGNRLAIAGQDVTLFTSGSPADGAFFHALIQKNQQ